MSSVRVETTAEDFAEFSLYVSFSDPSARTYGMRYTKALVLMTAPFAGWLVSAMSGSNRSGLLVAALVAALMLLIGTRLWRSETRHRTLNLARANKLGLPGLTVVTLEDDGVLELCPEVATRHSWIGIDAVDDTADYVVIRLKGNRGIVLPKRGQAGVIESFGRDVADALAAQRARMLDDLAPVEQAFRADSSTVD